MDENLKKIEQRKKIIHDLDFQINKFIIDNYKIDSKEIEILYEKKIDEKKREIKLKKHELEMYHQLFGRTYKINQKPNINTRLFTTNNTRNIPY